LTLAVGTPRTFTLTILMLPRRLQRLGLRPRRHTEQEHLMQRPDPIRQARRHRRCTRLPQLR